MPVSGTDFIDSLRALFEEAGENGRDAKAEFVHLRSIIIKFVTDSSGMTAAKARANCNLKFTDGRAPETVLALTPSKLDLAEKRAQLDAASTDKEFIDMLQTLIDEQKASRRGPKRNNVNKRPNTSPLESPRNKFQKPLEAEAAQKSSSTNEESPRPRIRFRKRGKNKNNAPNSPVTNTAKQIKDHSVTKPPSNEDTLKKIDTEMTDSMDINSPTASSLNKSEEVKTQQKPLDENHRQEPTSPKHSRDREDIGMEDAPNTNTEVLPAYCPSYVLEVVDAAKEIGENEWNEFKPKLLQMLGQMHVEQTPEEHEAAVKRLQAAITATELERSLIPAETWKGYEEKLIEETKKGSLNCYWPLRQSRIGKIIYLKEEEEVMESQDWERLRKAARLWAILTEMTSQEPDEVVREKADEWLIKKLGDISFLERLFACKKHLGGLKGPGGE